jgi:hypothetical protein
MSEQLPVVNPGDSQTDKDERRRPPRSRFRFTVLLGLIGVAVGALREVVELPANVAGMGWWGAFWYSLGGASVFVVPGIFLGLVLDGQLGKKAQPPPRKPIAAERKPAKRGRKQNG